MPLRFLVAALSVAMLLRLVFIEAHCWDKTSCMEAISAAEGNLTDAPRWLLNTLQEARAVAGDAAERDTVRHRHHPTSAVMTPPSSKNWCPNNGAFEFVPIHVGNVKLNTTVKLNLTGRGYTPCYETMEVSYMPVSPDGRHGGDRWGYIHFTRPKPSGLFCEDYYGLGTKFSHHTLSVSVAHSVVKKMHVNITYQPYEFDDISRNGINIFIAPCGVTGTVTSLLNTVKLFKGLSAKAVTKANQDFLVGRGTCLFEKFEAFNRLTSIDKSLIRSGDNLQVLKLDGLDPLIAFGTGGRTGHTTIAVWEGTGPDRQLWVCESTDASPTGAYWPPPYGIIRTPWDRWIPLAVKAGFSVDLLPLSSKASAAFSEDRFWDWFRTVEGMPYGYHVMLMSFLDTAPNANLPMPMDDAVVQNEYLRLDRILKHDNETIGANLYSLIVEGINHRINTTCKGDDAFACIGNELSKRNMSFSEATAIPEDDSWRYDADPTTGFKGNFSMMCSAFVANAMKVGFGSAWPPMNSHEFTPKDVYQLRTYNQGIDEPPRFNSTNCPGGLIEDAAGNGAYCQLLGPWRLPLNGYNSVPIWPHMNEACAAQWPAYATKRPC